MIGAIISLAVLLMVGVLILGQFQTQVETNEAALGDLNTDIVSANFTYNSSISLSYSPIATASYSVYNSSETFTDGTDYTIDTTAGTINISSIGSIDNTSAINVRYSHLAGSTYETYTNVKNSSWGAMNLMGMYPWILGAVAILSVVVLIGRK